MPVKARILPSGSGEEHVVISADRAEALCGKLRLGEAGEGERGVDQAIAIEVGMEGCALEAGGAVICDPELAAVHRRFI